MVVEIENDEKSSTQKAIEEIERGEVEVFEDFEAYKKAMKNTQNLNALTPL